MLHRNKARIVVLAAILAQGAATAQEPPVPRASITKAGFHAAEAESARGDCDSLEASAAKVMSGRRVCFYPGEKLVFEAEVTGEKNVLDNLMVMGTPQIKHVWEYYYMGRTWRSHPPVRILAEHEGVTYRLTRAGRFKKSDAGGVGPPPEMRGHVRASAGGDSFNRYPLQKDDEDRAPWDLLATQVRSSETDDEPGSFTLSTVSEIPAPKAGRLYRVRLLHADGKPLKCGLPDKCHYWVRIAERGDER